MGINPGSSNSPTGQPPEAFGVPEAPATPEAPEVPATPDALVAPTTPATPEAQQQPSRMSRFLDILEPILLLIVPVVLVVSILNEFKATAFLSALVATVALVPFFLRFESAGVKPRDIMPIVVMSAIAVALRVIMSPLFFGTPVTAVVIIAGLGFGKRSGFMTGALTALVSNLFLSQGPWTPWQMYLWGLIGYTAGVIADRNWIKPSFSMPRQVTFVCIFGAVMSEFYTVIMDTYSAFGMLGGGAGARTVESVIAVYVAGISYGMFHTLSTVLFLLVLYAPWTSKFVRIKAKYGIGN